MVFFCSQNNANSVTEHHSTWRNIQLTATMESSDLAYLLTYILALNIVNALLKIGFKRY